MDEKVQSMLDQQIEYMNKMVPSLEPRPVPSLDPRPVSKKELRPVPQKIKVSEKNSKWKSMDHFDDKK
jgi:hypothetical protein